MFSSFVYHSFQTVMHTQSQSSQVASIIGRSLVNAMTLNAIGKRKVLFAK